MKMKLSDVYKAMNAITGLRRQKLATKFAFRLKRATRPVLEVFQDLDEQLAEIRKEYGEKNAQGGYQLTPGTEGAEKAEVIISDLFKEEVEVKLADRIPESDFIAGVKEISAEEIDAIDFLFLEKGHGDEKADLKAVKK